MKKLISIFVFAMIVVGQTFAADAVYKPLWLYQGSWKATMAGAKGGPMELVNDCAMVGRFFACQQTVNGKPDAMIVFVPADAPGDYYTQAVRQDGFARGRGQLHIEGDHWTYSSKDEQDGKTTYYRTTNVFSGNDRIHFEQSESADGKTWKVTGSGDEVRVSKGK